MAMTNILFVDVFLIKASISREIPIAMFDYPSVTKTMKGNSNGFESNGFLVFYPWSVHVSSMDPMDPGAVEANVSVKRLEKFLSSPEITGRAG